MSASSDNRPAEARAPRYLGLDYLRAIMIVRVVAVHSATAYADFPVRFPGQLIIDPQRWRGFLYFVTLNDIYGMALLFFISGLFSWSGLARKGALGYGLARARRLGIPFAVAALTVMPLALLAAYRANGVSVDPIDFFQALMSGKGWQSTPLWFISLLLAFDLCAAVVYRLAPGGFEALGSFIARAAQKPLRFYFIVVVVSLVAYLPMMLAFGPFGWVWSGPFALQPSRLLLYALYFFVGIGVGSYGLRRGPLSETSGLVQRWARWVVLAGALHFFFATALFPLLGAFASGSILLAAVGYALAFVATCAATVFALLALFQRFVTGRIPLGGSLAASSYGIYVVHLVFVFWAQYFLLSASLPSGIKVAIVFALALGLSWLGTALGRRLVSTLRKLLSDLRALAPHPMPDPRERGE